MSKVQDLSGNRYHMLTVIHRVENSIDGYVQYLCLCDCGQYKVIKADNLRNGNTHSCGCLKKKMMADKQFKHGEAGSGGKKADRLYGIWDSMKRRCYTPSATEYSLYGGRGITVCDEWCNDYLSFKRWAIDNGYTDNLSIDRIDNNGNYCPENCRWVTMREQMQNKSNNRVIVYDGQSKTLTEWANDLHICRGTLSTRINKLHWSIEKALSYPVRQTKEGAILYGG